MLLRAAVDIQLSLPPSTAPPAFPGLVSSLRPLKRIASQVRDESALLRRFTYKNKNQFKGTGWWRKLVEVDRVTARAVGELGGLLGEFGIEAEKDDPSVISREAVCKGLLRLPRAMLVVEKTIDSLLGCASILEQLIHSRAFLAFALVVVALVARLHSLFTVLFEDLSRTSGLLVKLVKMNGLLPALSKPLRNLPRDLRRFLPIDSTGKPGPSSAPTVSLAPSSAATPLEASPAPSADADDIGAVVSRSSSAAKPAHSALSLFSADPSATSSGTASPALPASKVKKIRSATSSEAPSRRASPTPLPLDLPSSRLPTGDSASSALTSKKGKRPHVESDEATLEDKVRSVVPKSEVEDKPKKKAKEEKVKVKKVVKKRQSGGGDEIDAIFG
ncbi:hypothetical protein JCM11251_000344 [Rhodosporidiobolus azoricus]